MSTENLNNEARIGLSLLNVGLGIGTLFALAGCTGATGNITATDPTERGLSYVAAAIVTAAVIKAICNK